MSEQRAPVQGDGHYTLPEWHPRRRERETHPPGTIAWHEHLAAWERYAEQYGRRQSAERIAERGGFSFLELRGLLGRDPQTWEAR